MLLVRKILLASIFLMVILTAGCTNNNSSKQENSSNTVENTANPANTSETAVSVSPPLAQEKMQVIIYHATNDAMYLVPEVHVIPQNDHPAQTAMELLLKGTKNPALASVMPPNTKLKNIWVKDHIAYVDFNDSFIKNKMGGSTTELLLVGSIVDTLTEFPDIQKVQILVEGKKIGSIFGHMDTEEPLSRLENLIKKP